MSLKFLYDNLIEQAMIYPSSEDAQFPASNIKDARKTKVYRSLSNTANVVFDLGDIFEIDTFAICDSNISGFGFDSITLQLNNTDAWVTPPFSQVVPIDFENGICFLSLPSVQSYRYARLVLSNTGDVVELSKVAIGKAFSNENICFSYPIEYRQRSNAITKRNIYGQKFFDEINTIKEFDGTIPSLNKDEMEELMMMLDNISFTRPVWVIFNALNILNDANRLTGRYYLKDDPNLTLEVGNYWSVKLSFEESA